MNNYSPKDLTTIFLFVVVKRKRLAIGSFLTFFFTILFATFMMTPKYKATAKILVRSNPQQQIILFRDLEIPEESNKQINQARNLIEISTSRNIAEAIVKEFNLHLPAEPEELRDHIKEWVKSIFKDFKRLAVEAGLLEDKPVNLLTDAIEELLEDVQDIQLKQDTEVIDLSIWGKSPRLATEIANTTARLLVEKTREIVQAEASEAFEFTAQQVSLAELSLSRANKELKRIREKEQIVSPSEEQTLLLNRLAAMKSKYQDTSAELEELLKKLEEVRSQFSVQPENITSSTTFAASSVVEELKISLNRLSGKLSGLLEEHSYSHPKVKEISAELSELRKRLSKEEEMVREKVISTINPIHQELKRQLIELQINIDATEKKRQVFHKVITGMQKDIIAIANTGMKMVRIEQNRDIHSKRVETLQSKLLELEVMRLSRMGEFDIRVIDPAYVPEDADPSWPDLKLNILLGSFLSLFAAIAAPFFVEFFNDSLDIPVQVEQSLGVPLIGVVPAKGAKEAIAEELNNAGIENFNV